MVIESTEILRLKTELFKTVTFLQAMPITRKELEENFKNGPGYLENIFYNDKDGKANFLVKSKR